MSKEDQFKGPEDYWENPYAPNELEVDEWGSLPLKPVEALHILVNRAGRLSPDQRRALSEICDSDDEGHAVDYISTLRNIQSEDDEHF